MILREHYISQIRPFYDSDLIKIITGIRRSGKSVILSQIKEELEQAGRQVLSLNFENTRLLREIPDADSLISYVLARRKEGKCYVFLDEVQLVKDWNLACRTLRLEYISLFVTGSNSKFLSKDILTEFEGRGDEVHVLPLSFSEYYAFKQGEKEDAYDDYSVYGGLPAVALMTTEEQKTNYLISQMKNVYLRDIILRYSVQDETALGEVMDVIASGISTLTNPRKIASTMNSVHGTTTCDTTVDKYIGYAEEAFILNRVKRYNVKGRKYIGTPYKIYFEDIGLRNAWLAFRQIEETHIMENIIYNELRFRGYQVDVGTVESREKDADGKDVRVQREIDFIATLGSKKYYIQSSYAIPNKEKYEQETMSFERTKDSFKKIIIVEKSMKPRYDENGYLMMGVKEFLLDANSLLV